MVFISGGGNYLQSAPLDDLFFERCKSVLYIPIGLRRNFSGYEGCWDWFCTVCQHHNFCTADVDMFLTLDSIGDLSQYDGIYIGGASDIHWLNSVLVNDGFAERLRTYMLAGGNIYGGSAGGVVLGHSLDLQSAKALRLLPFSVLSHYTGENSKIISYFNKNTHPLVILQEDSGIIYDGQFIKSVGISPARVYISIAQHIMLDNNKYFEII